MTSSIDDTRTPLLGNERRTVEEYEAQGLLMGMTYDERTHTFWTIDDFDQMARGQAHEIDADTLRPLSRAERHERYEKAFIKGVVTIGGNDDP